MSNTVSKSIILVNNLNGQILTNGDVIYSIPSVTITALVSNTTGYDTVILWDFGDGTKIKGKTATHSYLVNGRYKITCTLFDSHGIAYANTESFTVSVVSPFESFINFTKVFAQNLNLGLSDIVAGETFDAGEFFAYLNAEITKDVPILCFDSVDSPESQTEFYQHLQPTFNFYSNEKICSEVIPSYNDAYVSFSGNLIKLYILNASSLTTVDLNEIAITNVMKGFTVEKSFINNINELSGLTYFYIGRVGKASVKYRADLPVNDNKLSFVLDQRYFPTSSIINGEVVNLVSLAYSVDINPNIPEDKDAIFYSANGLTTNSDISKTSIEDNKYSVFNAKYVGVRSPIIFRIISNTGTAHFAKDFIIDSINLVASNEAVNISYDLKYTSVGSAIAYVTTHKELDSFSITGSITYHTELTGQSRSADISINGLKSIDLTSFTNPSSKYYLDPKQKYENITGADVWSVYKTHDMFGNVPNLDKYMEAILDNGNLMRTIINSGYNFVDDFGNINTATIKSLVSTFNYLGITPDVFDIDNFATPNVINKLMQIFSITHSRLIGTEYHEKDEFITHNGLPGKNLGEPLNKFSGIYVTNGWPFIIAYDKFAKQYIKINTKVADGTETLIISENRDGEKFFIINDYSKDWGWGLLANDADELFQLYDLYLYIPNNNVIRTNSFLAPETISDNIKDYATWTKTDGSIDRLLYKTFIETLDLNMS